MQASKQDSKQPAIASLLPALAPGSSMDALVASKQDSKQPAIASLLPALAPGSSVDALVASKQDSKQPAIASLLPALAPGSSMDALVASKQDSKQPAIASLLPALAPGSSVDALVASKQDSKQPAIASLLPALAPGSSVDALVVGCGPAGIYLAAQLAEKGLKVGLVGPDGPFVNNYGVWVDEFKALGMGGTLEREFSETFCYFQEKKETRVGRAYGRVSRRLLREHLLKLAAAAGVQYMAAAVEDIQVAGDGATATVTCSGGAALSSRLVTLASGQAAGRFLRYEDGAPTVAAQTAYGIEAEVQGYHEAYDSSSMLFMDYRRHHSGLWDGAARHLEPGLHPNAGEGLWGSSEEVPSFLYAMPLGGNRVFLEETCLVAKPALPFAVLKRRLERRLAAMNVKVNKVHEEEWSYIPVGGPLPVGDQPCTAFGAAANLVHPATGFSVSRSLRQAPEFAAAAAAALAAGGSVQQVSSAVWQQLWSKERRQQAAFHVFGMELLTQLDLAATNDFFKTFFALPDYYWRGFLGSNLSSVQLLVFAFLTFLYAPVGIKAKLVSHLITDPAGKYLIDRYLAQDDSSSTTITSSSSSISSQSAAAPSSSSNAKGNGVSASSNGSSAPEQEAVLPAAVAADASSSR
uniref:Lycopene epsilon cyclase n=1 Tax=Tetradesmus obliquus TaxID=3088 RepID=A0A383W7L8_TETOB|eukprot:jgi/Sobl393_1/6083/SZX72984.1